MVDAASTPRACIRGAATARNLSRALRKGAAVNAETASERFTIYGIALRSDGRIGLVLDVRRRTGDARGTVSESHAFDETESWPYTRGGIRKAQDRVAALNRAVRDAVVGVPQ